MESVPTVKVQLPPKITKENMIGFTYGMRPYREGGIRLERENIKNKVIYHNYGHGGGGASLAPGCSKMIVDLFLLEVGDKVKEVAIIGGGYMGLFQAIILADLGYVVNIYAKEWPVKEGWYKGQPLTTSQVAGGWWMPFGMDLGNWPRHEQLTKDSFSWFVDVIEKKKFAGISWKDSYLYNYTNPVPEACPKGLIEVKKAKLQFNGGKTVDGEIFKTILIDGDMFLNELLDEAKKKGVIFHDRTFNNLDDVLNLRETVIFNCLAWGSYQVFGDKKIIPIAGHLLYMKKIPGVDYFFNYKRKDGWVVSLYPQGNKLAIGLAYEKIGWIDGPKQESLDTLFRNYNEFIDEYGTPKPKL
jgi:hypothetical protein